MPVTDLRGRTFGRLTIPARAEPEIRNGYAYWPCRCECSRAIHWVRGKNLIAGRTVSCGCQRADPDVRRAARYMLTDKRRHQIAVMGGEAFAARQKEQKI